MIEEQRFNVSEYAFWEYKCIIDTPPLNMWVTLKAFHDSKQKFLLFFF